MSDHATVRSALADNRLGTAMPRAPVRNRHIEFSAEELAQIAFRDILVDMDPPRHTELRRLVMKEFSVRRMRALAPRVTQVVDSHISAMAAMGGPLDLVEQLALPVPSLVICELLGVPYEDRADFQRRARTLFALDVTKEQLFSSMVGMRSYMLGLVASRRVRPADDVITGLTRSSLTDDQIAALANALLAAGHETTASMIGMSVALLLQRAESWGRLPSDVDAVVEESLRFLPVVQMGLFREAKTDLVLGGQAIAAGELVLLSVSAANRDEGVFSAADTFDPGRDSRGHLGFGFGVHQCLGQQLARIELRIVLSRLAEAFPLLRLAVPAERLSYRDDSVIGGVLALPVTFE